MSTSDRGAAIARRKARIAGHLRAGKTVGEICDLEGLDPANEPKRMRKEVAEPEGLAITPGHNTQPPVGLLEIPRHMRYNLAKLLRDLRDEHHYVDVAHMIGLTNIEQARADKAPYTHNWTLSQIQRLAAASGKTFEEVLTYMHTPYEADATRMKV